MPIAPATVKEPLFAALVADKDTVAAALVFAALIVPAAVVCSSVALVATKLNAFNAEDAPVIDTVPVAVSDINTLPFPAFAITLAAAAVNGEATLVPMFPFNDVKLSVCVLSVPVMAVLRRLL